MNVQADDLTQVISEAFSFEVVKLPLYAPDNQPTGLYGLFRDDLTGNDSLVGSSSVTSRYVPHTNDDVVALVEAACNVFEGEVDVNCYFHHGHYVSVKPTQDYRVSVYGETDNVWPSIVIGAGYDGRAFEATIGTYRDLCANLALMRQVMGTTQSIRHTRSLRPKMNDLIATFNKLESGWANLQDVIHHMESREVDLAEFLLAVYGTPDEDSKRSKTIHRNRIEAIFKRVRDERFRAGRPRMTTKTVTAWEAYNAVQGHAQHDATRRGDLDSFGRILLASRDGFVKRAEELAIAA
jgi:hypothetical protein